MIIKESSVINGDGLDHKALNQLIREKIASGQKYIQLDAINGQRYIGSGIGNGIEMEINGVAGNDLAAFSDGVMIRVNDSVQDCVGNTMNAGKIIIDGHAGDLPGYSQRGGSIYINGDAGYRAGIHMKGFKDKQPLLMIGGKAGDFTGEYMAGGRIVILGLGLEKAGSDLIGDHLAPGMHGGEIFIRGKLSSDDLGPETKFGELNQSDLKFLEREVANFKDYFDYDNLELDLNSFSKVIPDSNRPYGNMYV